MKRLNIKRNTNEKVMMKTIVMIVLVVIPRREEGITIKRKDGTKNIRKRTQT